ncbi:sugar ABC transporter ATP-binding protein [Nocardioides sp.]|uniref:sugar ABC transporter ATP-binding protein n=1 Tax=Nocardioides sp. TaxID=35761 RepID=UPI0039E38BE2
MSQAAEVASALSVRGLTKSFGGNPVLRGVDLEVGQGQIHALLGENGAGKSTLIKILAGVYDADGGEIRVGPTVLPPTHTADDARAAGLAFVHQNLGLIDGLSVADNVALQVGYATRNRLIDARSTAARVGELIEQVGARFSAHRLVGSLTQDEKVLCALARAFALDARVVVLDEVSASLPAPEMDKLAESLLESKAAGMTYLFVTHRLSEVFSFADRLTVLRDGTVSLDAPVSAVTPDGAVEAILGEALAEETAKTSRTYGDAVFSVSGLRAEGLSADLDLEVRRDEIVAVCGLVGSGTRTVARVLGGAERPTAGSATLGGRPLPLGRPTELARAGCAYVPGRRQAEAVFPLMSVCENTFPTRSRLSAWTGLGWARPRAERESAQRLSTQYAVKGGLDQAIDELSGGNQQKVVMARTLAHRPEVLILEDPTAGVDVGSRAGIHRAVREVAAAGTGVLLVSTDFEEVASQADRVLVMRDGRVAAVLSGEELTLEALVRASHGADRGPASDHVKENQE